MRFKAALFTSLLALSTASMTYTSTALSQSAAPQSPSQKSELSKPEITVLQEKPIAYSIGRIASNADYESAIKTAFNQLYTSLAVANIKTTGLPFVIYAEQSAKGIEFWAGSQIETLPDADKRMGLFVNFATSPSGNHLKFIYKGSYKGLEKAYSEITKYAVENKIQPSGPLWEEYANNPENTAADDLVTHIYVPVKTASPTLELKK